MNILVSWHAYFYRMGSLEGLFITTKEELESFYGTEVYFGEVLGKHSDITYSAKEEDFKIISEDQDKIQWLQEIIKDTTISGRNPIDYIMCEFCGDNLKECIEWREDKNKCNYQDKGDDRG